MNEPYIWSRDYRHSLQHFGWVSSWNLVATGRERRLCWAGVQQGWHYESSNCWHVFKHATAPAAAQRVWRRLGNSSETFRSVVWKKPNKHYEALWYIVFIETPKLHERIVLLLTTLLKSSRPLYLSFPVSLVAKSLKRTSKGDRLIRWWLGGSPYTYLLQSVRVKQYFPADIHNQNSETLGKKWVNPTYLTRHQHTPIS